MGRLRNPIAITGIGCRFPGGANDPLSFWKMLRQGVDAITEVPRDRWAISSFYDPEPGRPGKTYSKWGGFLEEIDRFDAGFFNITDAEANVMDPQQRLLLETAWEAMEDAGRVPGPDGDPTGVFVGVSTRDYEDMQIPRAGLPRTNPFSATGSALSIVANRLSYCFNLTGPSMAVDTACSSSLLAVHLACRSLWDDECKAAIAAGVNVCIIPSVFSAFSNLSALSKDGRCKVFDARADGFVRSEGAGAILLRPLDEAMADGDAIYAVILSTGTNQDGLTAGIALPSADAQAALLRQTCRAAEVDPRGIAYVESHGTGTAAGDPAEARALGQVLGSGRERGQELIVGAVKSNIGHTEAASGVAGIVKCALCLRHRAVPPNLHFETPNPAIDFGGLRLKVPTAMEALDPDGDILAGVSAFGFGGSNVFVLMRNHSPEPDAPATERSDAEEQSSIHLLPLSARTGEALQAAARDYAAYLGDEGVGRALALKDIVFTAARRRRHHEHRLTVAGRSHGDLHGALRAFCEDEDPPEVATGETRDLTGPVFVFTGQGPQWYAMGRQLYDREPVFRQVLDRCHETMLQAGGWSLLDELLADEERSRMDDTGVAQPSIFALQAGLSALWHHWGIRPAATVGHSVGEVAAAHVAGALSLEEAGRVVFHRSATMAEAAGSGRMLVAGLSEEEGIAWTAPFGDALSVAAVNGPRSVTLSGDPAALEEIHSRLVRENRGRIYMPVRYAFHSAQMDPARGPLLAALEGLAPRHTHIPFYSTVTGGREAGEELDEGYWWRNVRQTVRFAPAIEALARDGHNVFLELGPHPALAASIKECVRRVRDDDECVALPSLWREEDEQAIMLGSLGALHCLGCPVDWDHVPGASGGRVVPLPHYPWRRKRHWAETDDSKRSRMRRLPHPMLMSRLDNPTPTWACHVDRRLLPFLSDHDVQGRLLFPGSAYFELALALGSQVLGDAPCRLEDVEIGRPFLLPEDGRHADLQIRYSASGESFAIHGRTGDDSDTWILHAGGLLRPAGDTVRSLRTQDVESIRERCTEDMPARDLYAEMRRRGYNFGPLFRPLTSIRRRDGEAFGEARLPARLASDLDRYRLHPVLLDACFQLVLAAFPTSALQATTRRYMPVGARRLLFLAPTGESVRGHARLVKADADSLIADLTILDEDGRVLAIVEGFRCQAVEGPSDQRGVELYDMQWVPKPLPEESRLVPISTPSEFLPEPGSLAEVLQGQAREVRKRLKIADRQREAKPDLDAFHRSAVVTAFRELGWRPEAGSVVSLQDAMDQMGIAPPLLPLVRRCFDDLVEGGLLRARAGGVTWEILETLDGVPDGIALWADLVRRFPTLLPDLMLARDWAAALPRVLTGELDPAEHDASGEVTGLLVHAHGPSRLPSNLIVRHAIACIVARLPEGRVLNVLEVGGGAGGLAAHALPELPPDQSRYLFTDRSAERLSRAEDRFREFAFVTFGTFDIEHDPEEQELSGSEFDLVLGADVLRDVEDALRSLQHLRKMLAPGGFAILTEADPQSRVFDLPRVPHQGGWNLDDAARCPEEALLSSYSRLGRAEWVKALEEAGFESPSVVSDTDGAEEFSRAVYLARRPVKARRVEMDAGPAIDPVPGPTPSGDGRSWLILADRGGLGGRLAEALRARGHTTRVAPGGGVGENVTLIEQLLEDDYDGIVHLWSLDAAAGDSVSMDELREAQSSVCHSVLHLVRSLQSHADSKHHPSLTLVTRGSQPVGARETSISMAGTPLVGLGRVVANEHPELSCRRIDLSPAAGENDLLGLLGELLEDSDGEDEIALRGEGRYVQRLVPESDAHWELGGKRGPARENPCRLTTAKRGMLDHLVLETIQRSAPGPDEVEVEVCAVGLNFRDVMKALGVYPGEAPDAQKLGDEFAGRVTRCGAAVHDLTPGDRVFGLSMGAMATHVTVHASLVIPLPAELSMEEGATIPVAYVTAIHSLHRLARIEEGDRVLIHSAAGGVGQAAVRVALHAGAEVFGTAGTPVKRRFLAETGVHHVMDSHSLDFADAVMEATGGEGVDIVLNSLAGEAITRSLEVLRVGGRFLELGKRDIYGGASISLSPFRRSLSYFAIDMARSMTPEGAGDALRAFPRMLAEGAIAPLPYSLFPLSESVTAFRTMAQGKHTGKIVLSVDQAAVSPCTPTGLGEFRLRDDATYLITGGLRGLGLALAEQLAERGARNLVLTNLGGASSEETIAGLARLEAKGVRVLQRASDVAAESDLANLLAEVDQAMPPLSGVIHAAAVYNDAILREMSCEGFEKAMEAKAYGAWNLHRQLRERPLDFFVLISSISAAVGNPAQGNYAAANSFCDALAHLRRRSGLPSVAVALGRIEGVGHVARTGALAEHFDRLGWLGMTPEQVMACFDRIPADGPPHVCATAMTRGGWTSTLGLLHPSPRYEMLVRRTDSGGEGDGGWNLRQQLAAASPEEQSQILTDYLRREIADVLRTSAAKLPLDRPLDELGMDSLMSVELMARVGPQLGSSLPVDALASSPTIVDLANAILGFLGGEFEPADAAVSGSALPVGTSPATGETGAEDARLVRNLTLSGRPAEPWQTTDPRVLFLTGATGFLGAYLLPEILRQTEAEVICLVRAADEKTGRGRLQANLARYTQTLSNDCEERVQIVLGDLESPRLGLTPDDYASLAERVDKIYHNGALVNLLASYDQLRPANVLGTFEVLKFASSGRTKPVHFVSTVGVFGSSDVRRGHVLKETEIPSGRAPHGYGESKRIAEEIVRGAGSLGIPVAIYRPGMIVGDGSTGISSADDLIWRSVKSAIGLGIGPDSSVNLGLTRAEFVAPALVWLSSRESALGRTFHLLQREPISFSDIMAQARSRGYSIRLLDLDTWYGEFVQAMNQERGDPLLPYMARYSTEELADLRELLGRDVAVGADATHEVLGGSGLPCPKVDETVLAAYFDHFESSGFLPAPEPAEERSGSTKTS